MNLKEIEKQIYYKKIALIYYIKFIQSLSVKEYIKKHTHLTMKNFDTKLFNKHLEDVKGGIY